MCRVGEQLYIIGKPGAYAIAGLAVSIFCVTLCSGCLKQILLTHTFPLKRVLIATAVAMIFFKLALNVVAGSIKGWEAGEAIDLDEVINDIVRNPTWLAGIDLGKESSWEVLEERAKQLGRELGSAIGAKEGRRMGKEAGGLAGWLVGGPMGWLGGRDAGGKIAAIRGAETGAQAGQEHAQAGANLGKNISFILSPSKEAHPKKRSGTIPHPNPGS